MLYKENHINIYENRQVGKQLNDLIVHTYS